MIKHPFSLDIEDWYHGIELPFEEWEGKEDRLRKGLDKILELLDSTSTKCTFFVLGWIAERQPRLIRALSEAGHEIASHGYRHDKVYELTPDIFREETGRTKSILEQVSGSEVKGFRAPYFSITAKSLWALEILKECGFTYDCSITPVKTWRYGISGCPDHMFRITELDLIEVPVNTFKLLGKRFNVGGAYFRIFPYSFFSKKYTQSTKEGNPTMFYAHPWEFDDEQPVIDFNLKAKLTHYHNLKGMYRRTQSLLNSFRFTTISEVLQTAKQNQMIADESISLLSA